MKTVRDDDGNRYVLLKRSGDASLVRDPTTGNECYVGNDRLETVDGASTFETAAAAVSEPVRRLLESVSDARSLGLLLELDDRGSLPVRTILTETERCESELNGVLASLVAADLITEVTVGGERGYAVTDECATALSVLRTSPKSVDGDDRASDGPDDGDRASDGPVDGGSSVLTDE
ncbi:hypothetical protein [Halovivax sp.]|uniref:DUF7346 family protein n=1 Tax=Halovivax sp. TaxID=1935978 RepID=UPI0025BB56AA|nr:hypothetical protein [Halovivax sp.]